MSMPTQILDNLLVLLLNVTTSWSIEIIISSSYAYNKSPFPNFFISKKGSSDGLLTTGMQVEVVCDISATRLLFFKKAMLPSPTFYFISFWNINQNVEEAGDTGLKKQDFWIIICETEPSTLDCWTMRKDYA